MNIVFSDIVSQDYLLITAICALIFSILLLIFFLEKRKNRDTSVSMALSLALFCITSFVFATGYYDSSTSRVYFDRFQAFYEAQSSENGFWIQPELEELATNGTIKGQFFDNKNNGSNDAVLMLKRYFPSDEYNVSDLDSLRAQKKMIRSCVPSEEQRNYLIDLSTLPVSKSTLKKTRNELSVLYPEACKIS